MPYTLSEDPLSQQPSACNTCTSPASRQPPSATQQPRIHQLGGHRLQAPPPVSTQLTITIDLRDRVVTSEITSSSEPLLFIVVFSIFSLFPSLA
ncbi:hypothetical protein AAC387_Pa07g2232 [Persea americana]